MGTSPGVYIFKRNGRVAYVGRSDSDVDVRVSQSFSQGDYDHTSTVYLTASARQAYLMECQLFHCLDPIDNRNAFPRPIGNKLAVSG